MNRVYEIDEGRPIWKLRPLQVLITVVCILLLAVALVILAISGPLAESIGDVLGVGDAVVMIWGIAKWPVLAFVAVVIVALLYYSTPNVKQPRFRWLSVGAVAALVIWALASVAFSFYVANFGSYNKTYGSLAGVVLALLFLWIGNLALLFGAELDSELERGRELQAGMVAEEELQLPARDTRNIEKARKKQAKDIALGRRIREQSDTGGPPDRRGEGSDTDSKAGASAHQNVDATGRHKEN
jgi:membrane protein